MSTHKDHTNISLLYCISAERCNQVITNWTRKCKVQLWNQLQPLIHQNINNKLIIAENKDNKFDTDDFNKYTINGRRELQIKQKMECNVFMGFEEFKLYIRIPHKKDIKQPNQYKWFPINYTIILTMNQNSKRYKIDYSQACTVASLKILSHLNTNNYMLIPSVIDNFSITIVCVQFIKHKITPVDDLWRLDYIFRANPIKFRNSVNNTDSSEYLYSLIKSNPSNQKTQSIETKKYNYFKKNKKISKQYYQRRTKHFSHHGL